MGSGEPRPPGPPTTEIARSWGRVRVRVRVRVRRRVRLCEELPE